MLAQRLGHRGLGAVGDHLDRIDEMLALGTQALEAFLFGQFFEGDMALRGLALSFQRGDFFLQLCDVLLELGFTALEGVHLVRIDLPF